VTGDDYDWTVDEEELPPRFTILDALLTWPGIVIWGLCVFGLGYFGIQAWAWYWRLH
jgi:membrane protein DedA with SNARE-associated domain